MISRLKPLCLALKISLRSCGGHKLLARPAATLLQARKITELSIKMKNLRKAPYQAQDAQEVASVLRAMDANSKGGKGPGGFRVKKKSFDMSDGSGRTIDSWQLQDWDYKMPNLPTYARGLFTHRDRNGQRRIAVRGYDKFFNVEEVNETRWRNIETNTRGPYELSVKENGCIIFMSGLDDGTLLVTSKHSTGPRQDGSANHAFAGESWVAKQLLSIGRSKPDLARKLYSMNATAVAELCDDTFEEHVLAYKADAAGLYLHGINLNLPKFATYPGYLVDEFADEWGFKKVMYIMEDDISQAKKFLEEVAKTGNYAGRDTEGFVIRCQARNSANSPWYDWFFKYKFEEPYLMYRQWRECTKAVIAGKPARYKKHKKITEEYLMYARRQLVKDPSLGKLYNQNHGIIDMRNGFLAEKGLKGLDIIQQELLEGGEINPKDVIRHVLLIPVATIGCGKTTVALALAKLFGWGHEQNDNIEGKQRRPQRFAMAVTNSLAAYPAMIADRNNHQRRERRQIIEDVQQVIPDTKFVALHWVHDPSNWGQIRKAMQERVLSRGDNHQTIHAGSKGEAEIIGIMEGFLHRFEPVDTTKPPDEAFDLVIDLDVTASSRENLETIVNQLHEEYPKLFEMPSDAAMDSAIQDALTTYAPIVKHDLGRPTKSNRQAKQEAKQASPLPVRPRKPPTVEYFCISVPAARITAILSTTFASRKPETTRFYNQLKAARRVQPAFHVTLIHRSAIPQHPDYWNWLYDTWQHVNTSQPGDDSSTVAPAPMDNALGKARVLLERVVWDERVMCIVARLPDVDDNGWKTVNGVAHVTIGTAGDGIKPVESNALLKRWLEGGGEDERIKDLKIQGGQVVEGPVRGVLSRY